MQHQSARQNYLQGEVFTATPQKLQLLLIEAAIKNIHRTKQSWIDLRFDDGFETLTRAQDIVAEILCSLDVANNPGIAKKLASIYIFIFRRLAEGGMEHSQEKLDDALRVLTSERETWRLVCEKFGSSMDPANGTAGTEGTRTTTAASFTPSTTAQPAPAGSTAKILVSSTAPKPLGSTTLAAPTPLSADGTAKPMVPTLPPKPQSGYYTAGMSPLGKVSNLNPPKPTPPPPKSPPSSGAGNNWDA